MENNIKNTVKNIMTRDKNGGVKIPVFSSINEIYSDLFFHFKSFVTFGLVVTLFITISDFILKTQHVCTYSVQSSDNFFSCNESGAVGLGSFFIRSIFMIYFMVGWHKIRYMKASITDVLSFDKVFVKYFAFAFLYVLLMSTPAVSAYILNRRAPEYGITVELIIFGFIGIGILGPFFAGRVLIILAEIVFNKDTLPLNKLWQSGKGNNLKIVLLQLATLLFIFLKPAYMPTDKIQIMIIKYPEITTIMECYLHNFVVLIQLALMVNLGVTVHYYLYRASVEGENNVNRIFR